MCRLLLENVKLRNQTLPANAIYYSITQNLNIWTMHAKKSAAKSQFNFTSNYFLSLF